MILLVLFAGCTDQTTNTEMTQEQAIQIAQASVCAQYGNLTDFANHNDETDTWWIEMKTDKPGCYPGCVVYANGTANMSWACTGFVVPAEVVEKMTLANASTLQGWQGRMEAQALALCSTPNISGVYIDYGYIRVASPLLGESATENGSFFYNSKGELVAQCRIVTVGAPEAPCSFMGSEEPCMEYWFIAAGSYSRLCGQMMDWSQESVCPQTAPENTTPSATDTTQPAAD